MPFLIHSSLEIRWSGCVEIVIEGFCYNCGLFLVSSCVVYVMVLQLYYFLGIHTIIHLCAFVHVFCYLVYMLSLDLRCLWLRSFLLVLLFLDVLVVLRHTYHQILFFLTLVSTLRRLELLVFPLCTSLKWIL